MTFKHSILKTSFICLLLTIYLPISSAQTRQKVLIVSSIDKAKQPCYIILPKGYDESDLQRYPVLMALHTWSSSVEQNNANWEAEAYKQGWIYVFPHFRGPNSRPEACGSLIAQQDILDALAYVKATYRTENRRIYLAGVSGGGHMTMLMASRHAKYWTAASAWVGISDLTRWHNKHAKTKYGQMIRASCGGAPGASSAVDKQYKERSPIHYLMHSTRVPLDIAAGIHDGHTGSVPISHSLEAFNMIAKAAGAKPVSAEEMKLLSIPQGRLITPLDSDRVTDKSLGREIHLRRYAAQSRVTIFEGGHEGIAKAGIDWLARFQTNEQGKNVNIGPQ
ncbi:MAG: prolyl oligopeptidase [Planctomycetaceae bacterium]|nr:prolyl oligopeptidase [Planctomycetaceae bacterium]